MTGSLRGSIVAVHVTFLMAGLAWTSWVARIPQVRDSLGLDAGELGLVLLAGALGSFAAMPFAGVVVMRLGSARTVQLAAVVAAAGICTAGFGQRESVPATVLGLLLFGAGGGTWDIAMNVEAAAVERRAARAIMARFHASFSVGTVVGAGTGAACIALGIGVTTNLGVLAIVAAGSAIVAARSFLPAVREVDPVARGESSRRRRAIALESWREPRTLLIGGFVFCAAFTEGSGSDWIAVTLIDGHGAGAVLGAFAFGCFVATMTVSRLIAPWVLARWNRSSVLRAYGTLAIAGVSMLAWGGSQGVAIAGCVVWGLGISLAFPVAMSAASDDPARAAARVSVVSSIGYTAFIAGPPFIGLLADHVGIRDALAAIVVVLAIGVMLAGSTRQLPVKDDDSAGQIVA